MSSRLHGLVQLCERLVMPLSGSASYSTAVRRALAVVWGYHQRGASSVLFSYPVSSHRPHSLNLYRGVHCGVASLAHGSEALNSVDVSFDLV